MEMLAALARQPDEASLLRTMLMYMTQAETTVRASTFYELAHRVEASELRAGIMSIAEQLKQIGREEGRQEGLERGRLIGQIQSHEDWLHLPTTPAQALEQLSEEELRARLGRLKEQLRRRA